MTRDEKIVLAGKIKATLDLHHQRYPDSILGKVLHMQFNTIACDQEDADGEPRGTYLGAAGAVHPDSGGTDKGGG